jgi:hypothetical protein
MEANIVLDNTRLGNVITGRFTPSNAEQADAMANRSVVEQPMMTGLAMAIPGPKGAKGEALPSEANVVRGGLSTTETLTKAVGTHPEGVTGVSVESAAGKSVQQLAKESPTVSGYGQVRCCTVGDVRAAGGDVVPTSGASPNHATMTGLTPKQMNEVLKPPIPNPAKNQ